VELGSIQKLEMIEVEVTVPELKSMLQRMLQLLLPAILSRMRQHFALKKTTTL